MSQKPETLVNLPMANWLLITTHSVLMIERLLPDMADKNITSLDSTNQLTRPYQSTYKLQPDLLLEENSHITA